MAYSHLLDLDVECACESCEAEPHDTKEWSEIIGQSSSSEGRNIIFIQEVRHPRWPRCINFDFASDDRLNSKFYFNPGGTGFKPTAIGSEPQDEGLDSRDLWKCVMQGHAGANMNHIGKERIDTEHGKSEITFYRNSFIAGPTAEIIVNADDKEEAIRKARFNLGKIKSKGSSWGVFHDRRPNLYKVELQETSALLESLHLALI
ncbi:UNVERIFIED_CONTAM: N-carbamoylputrescine amidase [Sesamum calycinum]|uniref:N-carbamoylputrescine amidase n=1 Tax=Sesamum calycinum TaxID=2727403 RepID=A0AAW2SE90_9LAMI